MTERRFVLALDIGSNSVGSVWIDRKTGDMTAGVSVFPAGVDESDDKRGEPKNAKRRMTRRTRITLARRASRKLELRLKLIEVGLLPKTEDDFRTLLQETDPWELRHRGLTGALTPHQFGRVLLHLAQRRGALGLKPLADEENGAAESDDGKLKAAIGHTRAEMLKMCPQPATFGEFISRLRAQRVHPLTGPDRRPADARKGAREYRDAVRNKAGTYEHAADRAMIRDEFTRLWEAQRKHAAKSWGKLLTPELRLLLDDERGDATWKHKGLLFGQRRQSWDLGTLGRCVLEPTERCVPVADMHASYYRVVETVNNLKVLERITGERPLTVEERAVVTARLRGPLGVHEKGKFKGRPKRSCSVTDLREALGWGRGGKDKWPKLNAERDEDREINTDWFHREVVHGGVGEAAWAVMAEATREGINRLLLRYDPEQEGDEATLLAALGKPWSGLSSDQVARLVAAWKGRPKIENRLSMSRRAVLNMLAVMEKPRESPDGKHAGWPTQVEARRQIAEDAEFLDRTTGKPLDHHTRRRYATGAKGLSARDRHYLKKHPHDLPPAPMLSNPVVRRSIHEVRRHIVEYVAANKRFPDEVRIELAREAKMGAKDADRVLYRNRLRASIRGEIIEQYRLDARTPTQQRGAVERVVLAVQQGCRCPLCGQPGLTPKKAAAGEECEVAHILPRAKGGPNGLSNTVLAHTKCNREMRQDTPRQYWERALKGGHAEGMRFVESIYGEVERPKPKEVRTAQGPAKWACYFDRRDDARKVEQFTKEIKDIQEMTARQGAATQYAARAVMAYLADALFGGRGLPERGGDRLVFNNDGLWTSRLRREWGLFFDPHEAKAKGLSAHEEHARKEKNRSDHFHHPVDAVAIALCTPQVVEAWLKRERDAAASVKNPSDEEQLEQYRRDHPLPVPAPFKDIKDLRTKVRAAVFGPQGARPVAHRPVKRKLIGALHEESLFGPVLDADGGFTGNYTAKKGVLALTPNHLRVPDGWDGLSARARDQRLPVSERRKVRAQLAALPDPPPGKSGIVRDRALRDQLRRCVMKAGLDPDAFTANQAKKLAETGGFRHDSGVPIKSVVLLRTMSEPVIASRWSRDYATGNPVALYDAATGEGDAAAARAYVGGNNHHIELRSTTDKKGNESWSGEIVSAFEAAGRKRAFLRAVREKKVPRPTEFRKLPPAERKRFTPLLRAAQQEHPIVDRRDDAAKGGRFVMSLSEGETVYMKHKESGEPGYFVVAKLDKPNRVVLVPHWDARAAKGRTDPNGKPVPDSQREDFTVTPGDLRALAAPGQPHAVKVRVSPLGTVTVLDGD